MEDKPLLFAIGDEADISARRWTCNKEKYEKNIIENVT